jgi:hypothetical protein
MSAPKTYRDVLRRNGIASIKDYLKKTPAETIYVAEHIYDALQRETDDALVTIRSQGGLKLAVQCDLGDRSKDIGSIAHLFDKQISE